MLPIVKNILLSLLVVFAWSLSDVLAKYFVSVQSMNPHLFTFYKFLGAAFILILLSGKPQWKDMVALRNPYTWLYVVLMIIVNVMYAVSLKTITATEAALLIQAQIILHALVAYIFMQRKPSLATMPGYAVVLVAASYVGFNMLESKAHAIGLLMMSFTVLFCVARTVTAEIHPEVSKKLSFAERCKTTGYISFATSLFLLIVMLLAGVFKDHSPYTMLFFQNIPSVQGILDYKMILAGVLTGVFVVSIGMYVFFYVNSRFGAENFAIVMAFQPIINFIMESFGSTHFQMSVEDISPQDLIAGLAIVLAALYMLWIKSGSERKSKRVFENQRIEDHFDMISRAYNFCDKNLSLVSEKLDVDLDEVRKVLEGNGSVGFDSSDDKIALIERNYRRKIAEADYLTGLVTRSSLLNAMNGALKQGEAFTLIYLDLDKFKPINDTYGHDAGDEVLRHIAKRLKSIVPDSSVVCRLGGDEFALMLRDFDCKKIESFRSNVEAIISTPIQIDGLENSLCVGASIGFVSTKNCLKKDPEALLTEADSSMYKDKKAL